MGWKERAARLVRQATPAGQALTALDALRGKPEEMSKNALLYMIRDLLTDDDGLVAQFEWLKEEVKLLRESERLTQEDLKLQIEFRKLLEARVAKLEEGE